jgi:hypothetical protein
LDVFEPFLLGENGMTQEFDKFLDEVLLSPIEMYQEDSELSLQVRKAYLNNVNFYVFLRRLFVSPEHLYLVHNEILMFLLNVLNFLHRFFLSKQFVDRAGYAPAGREVRIRRS